MTRPATVVVRDGDAAIAKRHETLMDIRARHAGPHLDWTTVSTDAATLLPPFIISCECRSSAGVAAATPAGRLVA
jgi:hypothetical protein